MIIIIIILQYTKINDKELKISKMLIICLTNLKYVFQYFGTQVRKDDRSFCEY